jgi:hypothetical protein
MIQSEEKTCAMIYQSYSDMWATLQDNANSYNLMDFLNHIKSENVHRSSIADWTWPAEVILSEEFDTPSIPKAMVQLVPGLCTQVVDQLKHILRSDMSHMSQTEKDKALHDEVLEFGASFNERASRPPNKKFLASIPEEAPDNSGPTPGDDDTVRIGSDQNPATWVTLAEEWKPPRRPVYYLLHQGLSKTSGECEEEYKKLKQSHQEKQAAEEKKKGNDLMKVEGKKFMFRQRARNWKLKNLRP